MGHGGAHSLDMVPLTCFINFHFINSLLQSFNTQFSPEYESGRTDEPGTPLSRADTLRNAVKTKSVTHEMYITSDKIVLRREAAPSWLKALCLKHGRRECSCCSCRQTEHCARKSKQKLEDGQRQQTGNKVFDNVNSEIRLSNQLQIPLCVLELEGEILKSNEI